MKRKSIYLTFFSLLGFFSNSYAKESFKKITIIESNNDILDSHYKRMSLPEYINDKEYLALKEYVLSKTKIKAQKEPEIYLELMNWVSLQWKHSSNNAAPENFSSLDILKSVHNEGKEYRCVEYGTVLNDILISFGYVARVVGLKDVNADYGSFGMGHIATEVWSNTLHKWLFLDPQFNIYAKKEDEMLNLFDIYTLKKEGKLKEINFISQRNSAEENFYKDSFLTNYLGYISIFQKEKYNYSLTLKAEGKKDFLTFQGAPAWKNIFTSNSDDLYFKLNQTIVFIDYNEKEHERSQNVINSLKIKNDESYLKNMYLFAPKADFVLTLDHNMPWFKDYLVTLNNQIIEKTEDRYFVNLKEGINTIEAVSINQNGILGIPTTIKIKYE